MAVFALPVVFKADFLSFDHPLGEKIGFFFEAFNKFLRMLGFRGIHPNQSDSLAIDKDNSIAVNNTLYFESVGMGKREKNGTD